MYRFKNSLIALIGMASLMTVVTVVLPHTSYGSGGTAAPASSTQNVKVVNTLSEPVPIQGTVQAAQSGTWNVGINGTPTVNLGDGTSVNIANDSLNVNVANIPTTKVSAESTTVAFHTVLALTADHQSETTLPFDVSKCGQVRVAAHANSNLYGGSINSIDGDHTIQIVPDISQGAAFFSSENNIVLDIPGTFLSIRVFLPFEVNYEIDVQISVFCRP